MAGRKKKNPEIEEDEIDCYDPENIFMAKKIVAYEKKIKEIGFDKVVKIIKKEWLEKNGKEN